MAERRKWRKKERHLQLDYCCWVCSQTRRRREALRSFLSSVPLRLSHSLLQTLPAPQKEGSRSQEHSAPASLLSLRLGACSSSQPIRQTLSAEEPVRVTRDQQEQEPEQNLLQAS
jgi:hypothetical protein